MKYLILLFLFSCTPAQRDWKANTTIDVGVGTQDTDPGLAYGYTGMSYWLDYGFSATMGYWKTIDPYQGPYAGVNYSFTPFD